MENKIIQVAYAEPEDYFPKEIRTTYKLGEYAEDPMLTKIKSVLLRICNIKS